MQALTWDQPEDIAMALYDKFPEQDPLKVRFTDLHKWVTELDDFGVVSSAAVGDDASCFPAPRSARKQPAPGGRQFLRVALGHEHLAFPEVIDDLDFEAVRLLRQLSHGREARGHGLAPSPHRGNERPDVRVHALDAAT